jgi:ATP-dependent helicase YprA (DUF1998 family)
VAAHLNMLTTRLALRERHIHTHDYSRAHLSHPSSNTKPHTHSRASLSVVLALDSPLDQYLVTHADALFSRTIEPALADPTNPVALSSHLEVCVWYHVCVCNGCRYACMYKFTYV